MKRVLAFIMALCCVISLLPAMTIAKAATNTATDVSTGSNGAVAEKPFYMINCNPVRDGLEYVYSFPHFYSSSSDIGASSITVWYGGTSDIPRMAGILKTEFDNRPEGTRYFYAVYSVRAMNNMDESVMYFHVAEKAILEWTEAFLKEYKRIGGKLDGILLDTEYEDAHYWELCSRYYWNGVNTNIYRDMVNHPQYTTLIRPFLEERGFNFWPTSQQTTEKSELWSIYPNSGGSYAKEKEIWSELGNKLVTDCLTRSIFEPLMKYYPDAYMTDYARGDSYTWQKSYTGHMVPVLHHTTKVGNVSNRQSYAYNPQDNYAGGFETPDGYNQAQYIATPFNMARWPVYQLRNMYEADPNHWIAAHIAFFNYRPTLTGSFSNTPYYSENIYHIALMDPKQLLGYIVPSEVVDFGRDNPDPNVSDYHYNIRVVDELMAEMTRVAGTADRKPISVPYSWNERFMLSGMYTGGKNLWRITPDTSTGTTLEAFKIKDSDPTFYIDGQTITFPQGTIIEDSEISQVGTCGYWVQTPADVMPIVSGCEDRYAKYPSYQDKFENYAVGASVNGGAVSAWSSPNSGVTVQSYNGSNALLLPAGDSANVVNAPANITAGDHYALQQAWEVTVTAPTTTSGELVALKCGTSDKGVRIYNGKFYYDNNGSYAQLSGVTISAGSTYTIKREVDFRTAGKFTSSYSIYNASGTLLGSVSNVAMTSVSIPVSSITFSNSSNSSNVYIDNFKMYPTGVTTDLMLYDALTGFELSASESVRAKDTGYRLSWINTTNENLVAKIYNNGTLLQTVKMGAGMDGAVSGLVETNGSYADIYVVTEVDQGAAPNSVALRIHGEDLYAWCTDGGDATYFKVVDNTFVEEGSEDDYNLKVSYADGVMDVVCKDMVITRSVNNSMFNFGYSSDTGKYNYAVRITLIGENKVIGSGGYRLECAPTGGLTITGDGSLYMCTSDQFYVMNVAAGDLTIQDTTVTIEQKNGTNYCGILMEKGSLIVDNSTLTVNAQGGSCVSFGTYNGIGTEDQGCYIKNGSNVVMNAISYHRGLIHTAGPIVFENSNVELNNTYGCMATNKAPAIRGDVTAMYKSQAGQNYVSFNVAAGTAFSDGCATGGGYAFLKVTHTHTPVSDTSDCTVGTICATCGKVLVKGNSAHTPADDGDCTTAAKCAHCDQIAVKAKTYHIPVQDDGDCTTEVKCRYCDQSVVAAEADHAWSDFMDTDCNHYGCNATRTTSAIWPESVQFRLQSNSSLAVNKTVYDGGEAIYLKSSRGNIMAGGTADAYNMKVSYADGYLDVTLNNLVLTPTRDINIFDFAYASEDSNYNYAIRLHLIGENTITCIGGSYIGWKNTAGMIITGEGSLSITSSGNELIFDGNGGDLVIQDTTVNITNNEAGSCAVLMQQGNFVVDNSTVVVSTLNGYGVNFGSAYDAEDGSEDYGVYIRNGADVVMDVRSVSATHRGAIRADGPIVFDSSNVELCSLESCRCANKAPELKGNVSSFYKAESSKTYYACELLPGTPFDTACTTWDGYAYLKVTVNESCNHYVAMDDDDCTSAVVCPKCGETVVAARANHAWTDGSDTTCNNMGCYITRESCSHNSMKDDGDCTTAVVCPDCGETIPAKEHVWTDDNDSTCNNEGCNATRKTKPNAVALRVHVDEQYAWVSDGQAATYFKVVDGLFAQQGDESDYNMKVSYADGVMDVVFNNLVYSRVGNTSLFNFAYYSDTGKYNYAVRITLQGENVITGSGGARLECTPTGGLTITGPGTLYICTTD
ncbi:MAG: hypothetical protein IKK11_04625, partial [Oscillospiraceae bacterium]|nr:hypothetical protein [Oscillospiraceae bacterium]